MSMATSNNDRISSARLLDMLKGLQESRHLGSEPEVETVTTEITYVPNQYPKPGTYNSNNYYTDSLPSNDTVFELPIYVYGPAVPDSFNVPECEPEIIATLTYTKTYEVQGENRTFYSDVELPENFNDLNTSFTGYMLQNANSGHWAVQKIGVNGAFFFSNSQPVTRTETTTTKTKHTIKQDYVPNADWTQNDPDGEGYVEGRTHWVEESVTEVIPSAGTYNSLEEFQAALNSVEPSVVYVCDEYNVANFPATMPEYTGEPVAILDKEFEVDGLRVLGPSDWDGSMGNLPEYLFVFKQLPSFQANQVMGVATGKYYRWKAVYENVHKLDEKYYEHHNRTHIDYRLTNYSDWDTNAEEDSLFNSVGTEYGSTRRETAFVRVALVGGQIEFDTSLSPLTGNSINGVNADNLSYMVCRTLKKVATLTQYGGNNNGRIIDFLMGCSSFKNITDNASFDGYCKRVTSVQLQYYKSNGQKTYRLVFIGPKTAFVYNSEDEQVTSGTFELQIKVPTSFNNPRFLPLQYNYTVEDLPSYKEQNWTSGETNTLYDLPYKYIVTDESNNSVKLLPFLWHMTNLSRWSSVVYTNNEIVAKQRTSFTTSNQIPRSFTAVVPVVVSSTTVALMDYAIATLAWIEFHWQQANGELRIKFVNPLPNELVGIDTLTIAYYG